MMDRIASILLCWWLGWTLTWEDEPDEEQDLPPPMS